MTRATVAASAITLNACITTSEPAPSAPPTAYPAGSLSVVLEGVRRDANLPALATAVVRAGQPVEYAAVGVRRIGDSTRVTTHDRWHIGSLTKSVTASVAARLVDARRVQWTTTVGDALGTTQPAMHASWRSVTLAQLLTMRAGVRDSTLDRAWAAILANRTHTPPTQRRAAATLLLATARDSAATARWAYSNASYALAGHMLEVITGTPWEQLVRDEVFTPLGITGGGFGAPATPGTLDAPWGHTARGRVFTPVAPGIDADNPAAIGPAGTVHMTLSGLAAYASAHLASMSGSTQWLSIESGRRVHEATGGAVFDDVAQYPANGYAMGWLTWRDAASGNVPILMHDGSNRSFYAVLWMVPSKQQAFIVVTNGGDEVAGAALNTTLMALTRRYATTGAP